MGESQNGSHQELPVLELVFENFAGRLSRMDVDWDIEVFAGAPEAVPLRLVVEQIFLAIDAGPLRVIHQRAFEMVLLNAAAQLGCCDGRIVHRQCPGEADQYGSSFEDRSTPMEDC